MPIFPHVVNVSIFPHVFSRLDPKSKAAYRKTYINMKRTGIAASLGSVGLIEFSQLARNVLFSKLKAYGYKSLLTISVGPMIQFISIPIYIFSYTKEYKNLAIAISEIGANVTKGEMTLVNWAWVGADIFLFGEPISITEDFDLMLLPKDDLVLLEY